MLPFLRLAKGTILLVGLWYPAELIHRERASGIERDYQRVSFPDWLMILSKTTAICLVVNAMMLVAVVTLMAMQAAAGYTNFELGLYLQSAFIYNGIYYRMLSSWPWSFRRSRRTNGWAYC